MQRRRRHWTRLVHPLLFSEEDSVLGRLTSVLFATLLLGLQRLETAGVLPPAHHSMLEDMLEGWTYQDMLDSEQAFDSDWY